MNKKQREVNALENRAWFVTSGIASTNSKQNAERNVIQSRWALLSLAKRHLVNSHFYYISLLMFGNGEAFIDSFPILFRFFFDSFPILFRFFWGRTSRFSILFRFFWNLSISEIDSFSILFRFFWKLVSVKSILFRFFFDSFKQNTKHAQHILDPDLDMRRKPQFQ